MARPLRLGLTWILFLLAVAVAAGQEATVLPEPGKLLGFVSRTEPGKWLVFGPNGFKIVQPTIIEGGKAVLWQGLAGEYAVIYLPPGEAQPIPLVVQLGAAGPVPPGPIPPPNPPPLSPVAKTVHDWATTLVPPTSLLKCQAVAQSFAAISSRMAAGTLSTPAEILAATRDSNVAAVGDQRDAWLPFFEELRKFLNAESEAGKLADVKAHQALWDQIALGLGAVK
jgi:hypothetical protein